jgi:hypothetical protein
MADRDSINLNLPENDKVATIPHSEPITGTRAEIERDPNAIRPLS